MGWNVLFLLHLLCAMAGVHSQGNATKEDVIHNQAFEGEAVHSMMRAWVDAGTSPDVFSWLGWPFEEHPCANPNSTRFFYFGITCSTRSYQLEDSNSSLVQIHTLTGLYLEDYLYARDKPLVGGLPPAIVNLTNLETLFIKNATKLSGPLPTGLFCSSILQSISLTNCSFNGSIISGFGPSCGGNEELQRLDLSRNSFTKMIPFPFNDVHPKFFSKLQYLNVSYNQIKREFASVTVNLEIVDISNNFITNIVYLGQNIIFSSPLKSIYAQINSIKTFPSEIFKHKALQDINLDSNNISSIAQISSNINDSTIQKISMSKNKFQLFPEVLLQLPNLEELILDSNHITGDLHMPNISCQYSKIKLISLLYNGITHFYPSNDNTSCFSESRILSDNKIFLGGNPICTNQSLKAKVLQLVCRFNASSPIIEGNRCQTSPLFEELIIVKKSNKILQIIIVCVSSVVVALFIMGFFVIQKLKKKISLLHEIQSGVLPDGCHVAVKKLTKLSMEQGIQDFLSEIIVVSNIKHRNLVQLKGCCIKENQRILVHEFVENKNLEDALWGDSKSSGHLNWLTRFNIILGIARGLAYLHEDVQPAIVHRDIKGENILLDKHCYPKIADFGLALFFPSFDDGETHMSVSKIAGTKGYMAPEYLCYGQVSTKLDVFSFGVLVLEIVSGRKKIDLKLPSTEQYLVQWAQESHSNDNLSNLKDKSLKEMTMVEEAMFKQVVKVGLQCLHHIAARHPAMSEVVGMLIGNINVDDCALEDYHEGSSSSYDMGSSNFHFSTPSSSLQCIAKGDTNLHLGCESHKQSLELCEVGLLSK